MSKGKVLVTASDNIPFSKIDNHFGIVDSQIVVGANIFRDAFAGLRDIFGGETKGYKKDIDKMRVAALSSVKSQAMELGANAIISLKIDLDELSGGGKSMFMMNVYGSAVKINESCLENIVSTENITDLSSDEIEFYKERKKLKEKIYESNDIFKEIEIELITEYSLWDKIITEKVLDNYLNAPFDLAENFQDKMDNIPLELIEYYVETNFDTIKRKLWIIIGNSLYKRDWFNYDFLEKYLRDKNHIKRFRALKLSQVNKSTYETADIENLRKLSSYLRNNFDRSIPSKVEKKLLNKKEVYICPDCLKEADALSGSCSCGANKFGLRPKNKTIESICTHLSETADAIQMALKKNSTPKSVM